MTKDILVQYCDLHDEVKENRNRIHRIEKQLETIKKDGSVIDSVTGGSGETQHFKIEGFPYAEYTKKKVRLEYYKAQLEYAEVALLEKTSEVEEYIQLIGDSRMRRILRFRFVDSMTWEQVAANMGGGNNEGSVKMAFQRFFEKNI